MEPTRKFGKTPLYIAVWRWHFYAGIFVIPFMVLLAITGGIYLFRTEIEQVLYRDLLTVAPLPQPTLPGEAIIAKVRAHYPHGRVLTYTPPVDRASSVRLSVLPHASARKAPPRRSSGMEEMEGMASGPGGPIDVYVDPYTGRILGSQAAKDRAMQVVRHLHGTLLMGRTGEVAVELAAGWAFVLLVSGLYLWFPRQETLSVWGTLLPRLRAGSRTFWVDLHAVPALYMTGGILFLIVTGLPWTLLSGAFIKQFSDSGREGPSIARADRFRSQPPASPSSTAGEWLSTLSSNGRPSLRSAAASQPAPLSLAAVTSIAESRGIARPFQIALPNGPAGVYSVRALPKDPRQTAFLHLDQYSGQVLGDIRFDQMRLVGRAVGLGIAIHEGRMFGLLNQLLGLLLCLGCLLISFSAVTMWWKRRPAGRLGSPRPVANLQLPTGIVALTGLMGLLFPPVGVSLLAVLAVERFLIPRVPRLAWLRG